MRRAIIFTIVFSMAALTMTSAGLCSRPSSCLVNCEAAGMQTRCDGMTMQMGVLDDVTLSFSSDITMVCCAGNQAIRPESQYTPVENILQTARISASFQPVDPLLSKTVPLVFQRENASAPTRQSLLCTFLI